MAPLVDLSKYGYSLTFQGKIDFETNAVFSNGTSGKLAVHAEVSRRGNLNTNLVDIAVRLAWSALWGPVCPACQIFDETKGKAF